MSYRYHLMSSSGRCKTAICPIDERTFQPTAPSQMLELPEPTKTEHQEDARLFVFNGEPYVSYTEMVGYKPGVDFTCVMKYARLSLHGNRWKVDESWQPVYGRNHGRSKEKNWIFFEHDRRLFAVYEGCPDHRVLEIEGDRVVKEFVTAGPRWEWGELRGGTPPVLTDDGHFISIFHSSLPTEKPPAYVRYYAAAYKFEAKPPFKVVGISPRPILSGSEVDGHQIDPRYMEGWKPLVVFPCGLVYSGENLLISAGVNDWQCAIAKMPFNKLEFVAYDGSEIKPRFFMRENGSMPVNVVVPGRLPKNMPWIVPAAGAACSAGPGYMKVGSPREADEISELEGVSEISEHEFTMRSRPQNNHSFINR